MIWRKKSKLSIDFREVRILEAKKGGRIAVYNSGFFVKLRPFVLAYEGITFLDTEIAVTIEDETLNKSMSYVNST